MKAENTLALVFSMSCWSACSTPSRTSVKGPRILSTAPSSLKGHKWTHCTRSHKQSASLRSKKGRAGRKGVQALLRQTEAQATSLVTALTASTAAGGRAAVYTSWSRAGGSSPTLQRGADRRKSSGQESGFYEQSHPLASTQCFPGLVPSSPSTDRSQVQPGARNWGTSLPLQPHLLGPEH